MPLKGDVLAKGGALRRSGVHAAIRFHFVLKPKLAPSCPRKVMRSPMAALSGGEMGSTAVWSPLEAHSTMPALAMPTLQQQRVRSVLLISTSDGSRCTQRILQEALETKTKSHSMVMHILHISSSNIESYCAMQWKATPRMRT